MPQPPPTLLQYLYGEASGFATGLGTGDDAGNTAGDAARAALPTASPRLLAWCQAFDDWLVWRKANYTISAYRSARLSWRRLLAQARKPPWELDQDDLERHVRWLREQGFALGTARHYLSAISHFYRWCDQRRIDPACPPGFNPALDLDQLKDRARPAASARPALTALNREEARALLSLLRQDNSLLGQRDYAFFLARLRLGVGLDALRSLQWGQIEVDAAGARVRWRQPLPTPNPNPSEPQALILAEPKALPQDIWQAILRYLGAAGRLETIQPHDYIFAPMRDELAHNPSGLAEDWNPTRPLSSHHLWEILKRYGRAAGIPEQKLTLPALRRTAVLLRLEAGDGLEDIQAFMDTSARPKTTKELLRRLPGLAMPDPRPPSPQPPDPRPPDSRPPDPRPASPSAQGQEPSLALVPHRGRNLFKPGDGLTHGLYARQQPPEEVASMLAENVQGIDQELAGLRLLGRGLMERLEQVVSSSEAARLGRSYAQLTARMDDLVRQEQQIKNDSAANKTERTLAHFDHIFELDQDGRPFSVGLREEALGQAGSGLSDRSLLEETASLRVVLRRTLQLALQAQGNQEYAHLVDLYGYSCMRLVRLLKSRLFETELLEKALYDLMIRSINNVLAEIEEAKAQGEIPLLDLDRPDEEVFQGYNLANMNAYNSASDREKEAMLDRWLEESRQHW